MALDRTTGSNFIDPSISVQKKVDPKVIVHKTGIPSQGVDKVGKLTGTPQSIPVPPIGLEKKAPPSPVELAIAKEVTTFPGLSPTAASLLTNKASGKIPHEEVKQIVRKEVDSYKLSDDASKLLGDLAV